MIRKKTVEMIEKTLDKTYFRSGSFSLRTDGFPLKEGEGADTIVFKIDFLANPRFSFTAHRGSSYREGNYLTLECPGPYMDEPERFADLDFDDVIERIEPWVARILEDYRTVNPVVSELDHLRRSFQEEIKRLAKDPEATFTPDEKKDLIGKIAELEEKLYELAKNHQVTEDQLARVTDDLANLRTDLDSFPKAAWYQTAASKIFSFVTTVFASREGRELASAAVKGLLTKESSPDT
ncbi:MAG: hypothetical protein HQ567_29455 [Candidatus Nealsonbacteria bacterium]|nr:hypothetical protein [Candidatus Nealsonbacteria bacterium]